MGTDEKLVTQLENQKRPNWVQLINWISSSSESTDITSLRKSFTLSGIILIANRPSFSKSNLKLI